MPRLTRRAFLGTLAAAVPAAVLVRHAHAAAIGELAASPRTMRALGDAILPSELGDAGVAMAVSDFQRWIAGYREGAELVHGYGTSQLEFSGPTPATKWAAQLDALDARARRTHGKRFDAITIAQRRALVQADLDAVGAKQLPSLVKSPHVALAMLAHFYGSSAANDLCYQSAIGRQQCRPLAQSPRRPLPLARTGA